MRQNGLGGSLLKRLDGRSALTSLDVSDNQIRDTQLGVIHALLKQSRVLRILRLSRNGIDGKGAATLASGLRENDGLLCLDLSYNDFGNEKSRFGPHLGPRTSTDGVTSVRPHMRAPKGAAELFEAVMTHKTLLWLNVEGANLCGSDEEWRVNTLRYLVECVRRNRTIRFVNIAHNTLRPPKALKTGSIYEFAVRTKHRRTARKVVRKLLEAVTAHSSLELFDARETQLVSVIGASAIGLTKGGARAGGRPAVQVEYGQQMQPVAWTDIKGGWAEGVIVSDIVLEPSSSSLCSRFSFRTETAQQAEEPRAPGSPNLPTDAGGKPGPAEVEHGGRAGCGRGDGAAIAEGGGTVQAASDLKGRRSET